MKYRLGLDLGTNSIGWAVMRLNGDDAPVELVRVGSRIFSDSRNPKDGTSLAVARRTARQMRRRRDRYLKRRLRLLNALTRHGLFPTAETDRQSLKSLDPYELRAAALDRALAPHEMGRALFHLNQRRGFKSNRRVDRAADSDAGKVKTAIAKFAREIQGGARTVGEALYHRKKSGRLVRARTIGEGAKSEYEFYVDRSMVEAEFDAIWASQRRFHASLLTDEVQREIKDIILFQRPLRPVQPGRCTLEPDQERAPIALTSAQLLRIYQETNHLRIAEDGYQFRALTLDERDKVVEALSTRKEFAFDRIRKLLNLPDGAVFNLEDSKRDKLKGDITGYVLANKKAFGKQWLDLSVDQRDAMVERLLTEADSGALMGSLMSEFQLDHDRALAVCEATIPEGYSRFGRNAICRILGELKAEVCDINEAIRRAGFFVGYDAEVHPSLPYYGVVLERHVAFGSMDPHDPDEKRYGRIANPTVHVALNQLRKLVNALINRYGHPSQIAVEVIRDLKVSYRGRQKIQREQAENQKRNDRLREKLVELKQTVNGENLLRLKLWEELNVDDPLARCCVYTGTQISLAILFSPEVEIEHILPFTRTLDDSMSNKTLCLRRANRVKLNQTPFEAFGSSPAGYSWDAILARAQALPLPKRKRFSPDALEQVYPEKNFLARQLTDTAYIARVAKEYLSAVCPPNRIWVTPGRLTAMLRGKWGLNSILSDRDKKERTDERHHAVDAVVVGVTDRSLLQQVANAAKRATDQGLHKLMDEVPVPWADFRTAVEEKVLRCVVSYKPEHGTGGALFNDTAYGISDGPDPKGSYNVVHRIPIESIASRKDIDKVADRGIRELLQVLHEKTPASDWKSELKKFSATHRVSRVRIAEVLSVIPVKGSDGQDYKAYKGDSNYCYEIFAKPDGGWDGRLITTYEANQKGFTRQLKLTQKGESLIMRLCNNDMIAVEDGGTLRIMRVVKMSKNQIVLAEHCEGGALKSRDADKADAFRYVTRSPKSLRTANARRVFVDVLGRVKDPGHYS